MRLSIPSLILPTLGVLVSLVAAAPIITAGPSLTEATWGDVSDGTWLVEHYSPYCGHCRQFAPTWKDLVDTLGNAATSRGFGFAQVDCAANGDLCKAHDVKFYPALFLYVAGEQTEEYKGTRTLEELTKFVMEHMPPEQSDWVNDDGGPEDIAAKSANAVVVEDDEETKSVVEKVKGKERLVLAIVEEDSEDEPTALELLVGHRSAIVEPTPFASTTTLTPPSEPSVAPATDPTKLKLQFVAQPRAEDQKRESPANDGADGTVHVLYEVDDLAMMKAKGAGPAFVKFYAPWCGHCKTLAPKWKELAASVKGQVNVFEMDCDDSKNKKACRAENISGFPTLVFYNEGARVEYKGKRDPASMKAFAIKAATSTAVKSIANAYELKRASQAEDVIFLFLHPSDTSRDEIALAQDASKHLMAGPPFYISSSPDLFEHFSLSPEPIILVFKDHSLTPTSSFLLPASTLTPRTRLDLVADWLRTAKLGLVTELNSESYADVMSTSSRAPLVGLVVLSPKKLGAGLETAVLDVQKLGKGWESRLKKDAQKDERPVIWAWVDGDKWASWAKSLYGVKAMQDPVIVIADPKDLTYWKVGIENVPLSISGETVYELIEDGIYTGKVKPESSRNLLERFGNSISIKAASARDSAINHPLLALFLVSLVSFGLWSGVKWLAGGAPSLDRPNGGAKLE
ncbi:hypothetical protein RQP46_009693 [Phenoliferia psychrophenolica]